MDLLDDLGPQLRALTAAQPAQPGDRVPGVTRRAQRIRRTRAAVAAAAALAILTPAGLLVANAHQDRHPQFATTPITQWPDRSYKAERAVADGAFAAWSTEGAAEKGVATDLRWLFRGRIDLPDQDTYVAVFLATRGEHRWLVTSQKTAQTEDSSWSSDEIDLSTSGAPDHVGIYLATAEPDTSNGGVQFASVLLLLADPRAGQVRVESQHLPAGPVGPQLWTGESRNGVFISPPLTLDGPAGDVKVWNSPATWRQEYPFATGHAQPFLVPPPTFDLPEGWSETSGGAEQSELHESGRWSLSSFTNLNGNHHQPLAVFARCYGGGEVRYTLSPVTPQGPVDRGDVPIDQGPVARRGSVACDGQSHQAFAPVTLTSPGYLLEETTDRLQAVRTVVAERD